MKPVRVKLTKPEKLPAHPLRDVPPGAEPIMTATEKDAAATVALVTAKAVSLVPDAVGKPEPEGKQQKRQKLVGRHLPLIHCNVCRFADTCRAHKPGYECAFTNSMFKKVETVEDIVDMMRHVTQADLARAQQAIVFEQLSGAGPSVETTELMDSVFAKLAQLHEIATEGGGLNAQSKGVLQSLFGALVDKAKKQEPKTITVEASPPKESP